MLGPVEVEGHTGTHALDFGLRNGQLRAAVYAVSFQMATDEDMVLHRDHLAWAAYDIHQLDTSFPIVGVMSPPLARTRRMFDESARMLESVGVETVLYDRFDDMRERLVRTLFTEPIA